MKTRLNTGEIPIPTEGRVSLVCICFNLLLLGQISYTGIVLVIVVSLTVVILNKTGV